MSQHKTCKAGGLNIDGDCFFGRPRAAGWATSLETDASSERAAPMTRRRTATMQQQGCKVDPSTDDIEPLTVDTVGALREVVIKRGKAANVGAPAEPGKRMRGRAARHAQRDATF